MQLLYFKAYVTSSIAGHRKTGMAHYFMDYVDPDDVNRVMSEYRKKVEASSCRYGDTVVQVYCDVHLMGDGSMLTEVQRDEARVELMKQIASQTEVVNRLQSEFVSAKDQLRQLQTIEKAHDLSTRKNHGTFVRVKSVDDKVDRVYNVYKLLEHLDGKWPEVVSVITQYFYAQGHNLVSVSTTSDVDGSEPEFWPTNPHDRWWALALNIAPQVDVKA